VLPAAFAYAGELASSAAQAKAAGITKIPQVDAANALGASIEELQRHRATLGSVIDKAEGMHDELTKQADLLTTAGAEAMANVRNCCDSLELTVSDECWPLPKYREMLFPV
jgi:glutamine synthetase